LNEYFQGMGISGFFNQCVCIVDYFGVCNRIYKGVELMGVNVGKSVNVLFPGKKRIKRILHEDYQGLYVNYQNKIIRVKPHLNEFKENNTNTYIAKGR